ncbi:hypothetical protein VTJ04DRAFT_10263 [Mycothermus thermophilus]|uniref:uncharacterized protein n=1 Tax=Humicola insolens TaxID=85995 RepID=UPI0037444E48
MPTLSASGTQRSSVRERWRVPRREASSEAHVIVAQQKGGGRRNSIDIQMRSGTMDTPSPTWGTGLPGRPDAGKGGVPGPADARVETMLQAKHVLGNGIHQPSRTVVVHVYNHTNQHPAPPSLRIRIIGRCQVQSLSWGRGSQPQGTAAGLATRDHIVGWANTSWLYCPKLNSSDLIDSRGSIG